MNILFCILFIVCCCIPSASYADQTPSQEPWQWTIIGAGPAGIAVLGLLLDLGIPPECICWIDPEFNVGRLGKYYMNVPSNSTTQEFIDFLTTCHTFQACTGPAFERLYTYNLQQEYPLHIIVEPLQEITQYLLTCVHTCKDVLCALDYTEESGWNIHTTQHHYVSKRVILATGSHPKTVSYDHKQCIPLDDALDKHRLAAHLEPNDSIAVFGSAHSAILVLKYLSELPVQRIINFFTKPLQYAFDDHNNFIHGNGLRGVTAEWAKNVLEKNPPAHLMRIYNCAQARDAWLPICNKIIYAIGYERNQLPNINQSQELYDEYDASSGIIAPGLFGIGIAFPEQFIDPCGEVCKSVGLLDFMAYAQEVLPMWMHKRFCPELTAFCQLFHITIL